MHKSQLITSKTQLLIIKKKRTIPLRVCLCPPLKSTTKTPYLHLMYGGHFLCNQHAYLRIGHFYGQQWPRIDVLLDTAAGKEAKKFRPQTTLRQQCKDDTVCDQIFQTTLTVIVAVDAEQYLFGLTLGLFVLE